MCDIEIKFKEIGKPNLLYNFYKKEYITKHQDYIDIFIYSLIITNYALLYFFIKYW